MATKAQKRAAGIAKREQFLAEVKESGLKSQQADRGVREHRAKLFKIEAQKLNGNLEGRLQELIVRHSSELGRAVSRAEIERQKDEYERLRQEWREYVEGLVNSPHRSAAHEAYWNAVKAEYNS